MKTGHNTKGILRIETDGNNPTIRKVVFEPVDSTVWLHKAELSVLFGVYRQKITACLDLLLEGNFFDKKEVCRYELYVSGTRIRYDVQEVRLEVVIALAFRIDSPRAMILREWFIVRSVQPGIYVFPSDMEQGVYWN